MVAAAEAGEGLKQYYQQHIHDAQLHVRQKTHNLNRLQAQRNDLNSKVRLLKEELQLLQEPGSYVGEVVKVMGKSKVLVKVHPEGKYVVDIDKNIDITKITPSTRVALKNDSYVLHLVLPSKVDPLVNLMKVEKVPDSTYDMIGGLDQQIKEIKEVIELPIKHPELFESLGIAQPKGVLLYGPPGTGKTLLARAVAHHTDCTFIRVSGSELVQKYIGEGSRMVRELFVMAREHEPSIIFMDEIDSIGSARMESGSGNGDSEVQRTMLELLNQLDGFEASNKIKVLMATNRIDILDQALLRPGRIDRKIEFPNPSFKFMFGELLPAIADLGALESGWVHQYIKKEMNTATNVCTALVDMYACGEFTKARRVFDSIPRKETATWNALIHGLAVNGYGNEAINVFLDMTRRSIKPNEITMTAVLTACNHSGLVEEGKRWFKSMQDFGIVPKIEQYGCMIDLLGRAGCLDEAERFMDDMPFEMNDIILSSFLSACGYAKDVKRAERILNKTCEKGVHNDGNYITLRNLYAQDRRWVDVEEVVGVMRSKNSRKEVGCSVIEVEGHVWGFASGDRFHPQWLAIKSMLDVLLIDMKKERNA
ncbi:26S proteasome regulatory subunit 8 homolog A-like [Helianthus annuus]|uniref:26S proteasome regulatory subunit 8 homolog A-like n=1 Tax=Helianthus annuus TaxID=4232 RepID=UPI00165340AB|nr:26S proteasome regulatory subunit 8 homolog A-like [Helianthus annuus]